VVIFHAAFVVHPLKVEALSFNVTVPEPARIYSADE
jgi:hypothetical protein